MLDVTLIVTHDGTDYTLESTTGDQIAAERQFEAPLLTMIGEDPRQTRVEVLGFLAWKAMTRTGKTTNDFDDWVEGLTAIHVANNDDPMSGTP